MIPDIPTDWTNNRYRRWLEREHGIPRMVKVQGFGPQCLVKSTRSHESATILARLYELLDHRSHPDPEDLRWAVVQAGVGDMYQRQRIMGLYLKRYGSGEDVAGGHGLATAPIELAAAGRPEIYGPAFRSRWERRLAKAMTRLGIRWDYEPTQFCYHDWANVQRRYTPDFQLLDFHDTYVEVKGWQGADAGDRDKMAKVVGAYRNMTLLLWDAVVIEMVEEMSDRGQVLGLLSTTRLAA